MSFPVARAPSARQRIARWHNRYRFQRRKLSQKSLYRRQVLAGHAYLTTDDKRAAMQRLPDVTEA
jgi:hypothetical protein